MRRLSAAALVLLVVILSAIYVPEAYRKTCMPEIEKTLLLFSPTAKRFVYRDRLTGAAPEEIMSKAEDHHADIAYRDQDGTYYSRMDFEKMLPFVYAKNMELWGLLPIEIDGRSFGLEGIKAENQVMELTPEMLAENGPKPSLWPLMEAETGQARLVFPEDLFRMTENGMDFVNADENEVDEELSRSFTDALKLRGFSFPARSVNSKVTLLKPFDEGVFIVDRDYKVFHVKRRKNAPEITATPVEQDLKTRYILVSENLRRAYYGLILGEDDRVHLLLCEGYGTVPLNLEGYDPDMMDLKIVTDPLYVTAVWSDRETVHGLAMDRSYNPVARFSRRMSRAERTTARDIYRALFPFVIELEHRGGGNMKLSLTSGGIWSLAGISLAVLALFLISTKGERRRPRPYEIAIVAASGIYGLIAVTLIDSER